MKTLLLSTFAVLFATLSMSQNLEWLNTQGSTNTDLAFGIQTDSGGNVYVVGFFSDTVDFDPGSGVFNLTSSGLYDIFVQKLDAEGNFIWAKSMGGPEKDIAYDMVLDDNANLYITGYFRETANLDPNGTMNFTSAGEQDGFVLKMDASGNLDWVKVFGGTGIDIPLGIYLDNDGNVLVSGGFAETVDFDSGTAGATLVSNGDNDVFVLKLDANGDFMWVKGFGGIAGDYSLSVGVDASNNIYTTGYFYETVDFDPGSGVDSVASNGEGDVFVHKISADGDFLWVATIGGLEYDRGFDLVLDQDDNVIITGHYIDSADFDPGVGVYTIISNGSNDMFIQKLDSDGNLLWAEGFGGKMYPDYGITIDVDDNGSIYTSGYFSDTVDFNPGSDTVYLIGEGAGDAYVLKLDASGNYEFAVDAGGNGYSGARGIHVDEQGQIFTVGGFADTVDFSIGTDPEIRISNGSNDFFVQKYQPDVFLGIPKLGLSEIKMYPNPSAGMFILELPAFLNKAKVQILDVTGKLVYKKNLNQIVNTIDLTSFKSGVYFVRMTSQNGETFVGKVMIEK